MKKNVCIYERKATIGLPEKLIILMFVHTIVTHTLVFHQ